MSSGPFHLYLFAEQPGSPTQPQTLSFLRRQSAGERAAGLAVWHRSGGEM